jgi:hypothetical protein
MATSPPMIGGSDPSVLRSLETPTPSVARTSPPTVSASTGSATSGGTAVARGIAPQVSGATTTYNQATQTASGTSLTITSATSNEPADVVTVYNTNKAISVSAVNQTVNSYKVNNYAGNEYTDSNVAAYLPTFTGNVGAGNVNVTGTVYTSGISSTGSASLTILNVSTTANLGAVGNVTITGGTAGQVLSTNGSGVLSWASDATTYGNSNVVTLMSAFGSNTISTTGNITGGNIIGIIAAGSNTITTTGNITGGNINIPNGNANVTGTANTVGGGATVGVRSILAIDSAFGSNDANDPASAQAVRGRVTGSNLTKTRNYVAGVTGQYLVTGTNASEFINTGLLGVVGDQTTTANAAVVAYLDGDGGLTTAGSAYGVSMKNSTPGSGFDYGLDLQFINLNVAGTTTPFKQADIRFNNGVEIVANTAGNISINANVNLGNAVTANYFIGSGGNIAYQQTNTFYVDPSRSDTYTAIGTPIQPFKTVTAAISAAVTAGYTDSNPAFVLLLNNITENITMQPGIWLTSFGTGTHGSPTITGTITVSSSTGSISSNHYSISNLRLVAPTNGTCIDFTGSAAQRLFIRDVWLDTNGSGTCIFMDNSNVTSVLHLNIGHLAHSGTGDVYCIDVTTGNCYITDIETSGNVQVAAVRTGTVMTIDSSEIDANNAAAIEVYGGTLTVTNSIITNTATNSNGVALNTTGSVCTLLNVLFSIPTGTGNAVFGTTTSLLFYLNVAFAPSTNTSKTASPALIATQLSTTWT